MLQNELLNMKNPLLLNHYLKYLIKSNISMIRQTKGPQALWFAWATKATHFEPGSRSIN